MASVQSGRDLYDQNHKRRSTTKPAETPKQEGTTGIARGRALFDDKGRRGTHYDDNHSTGTAV
jgi:hypothetical protein